MERKQIFKLIWLMLFLYALPCFSQTTYKPPVDMTEDIPQIEIEKGYADTIRLQKYTKEKTPEHLCACILNLDTAQTVRFRLLEFSYELGNGSGFPNVDMALKIKIYRREGNNETLFLSLPWTVSNSFVDNTEKDDAYLDDDVISIKVEDDSIIDKNGITTCELPAGEYTIYYKGYSLAAESIPILNAVPLDISSVQENYMITVEKSFVEIVLESLPLRPPSVPSYLSGWNSIMTFTSNDGSGENGNKVLVFYDDFGRKNKTLEENITPDRNSLLTVQEYDGFGRASRTWMPGIVTGSVSSESVMAWEHRKLSMSSNSDAEPYSQTVYEASPLSRPLKLYGVGKKWHTDDKFVAKDYYGNECGNDALGCYVLKVEESSNSTLIKCSGEYESGRLSVVKTESEDGNVSYVFKDFNDSIIMERNFLGKQKKLDTYYVYDAFGNLCAVLPPAVSAEISSGYLDTELVNRYGYLYRYDGKDRLIAKKLPGCDWIYYAYDIDNRLIFTQDGKQRKKGETSFKLYDKLNRICVIGSCNFTFTPGYEISSSVTCSYVGKTGVFAGYAVSGTTFGNAVIQQATYYDNYSFLADLCGNAVIPIGDAMYGKTAEFIQGLATGSAVAVFSPDSTNCKMLYSLVRYNSRGWIIRTETENYNGGYSTEDTMYDFLGKPRKKYRTYKILKSQELQHEQYEYSYDHVGRLLFISYKLNDGEEKILADNEYDELGRLKKRGVNNEDVLSTNYNYNIRSWTTDISNPLFSEKLYYNERHGGNIPQYGGNISAMEWRVNSGNGSDALRGYNYTYDNLSRLLKADYMENGTPSDHYGTSYTYDAMGNILSLHRNGLHNNHTFDEIDNLTYTYEGNQLIKVDDSAQDPIYKDCFDFKDGADEDIEYEYDANGNMTKDLNHGICNIEYNCINLPSRVEFLDGSRVLYTYDAKGTKLRTDYYINPMPVVAPQAANEQGASSANLRHTWTDYCGNFIYENDTLKQTLIEGGYISYEYPKNTAVTSISQLAPTYHFYVQDHLGNNRLVVDEGGTIEQINHYYPFGGLMGESKNISSNQRYKYNGKEFDRMHGLDWYDYGARFHDPATVRWFSVDPLAHKYYGTSPYVYCANNPIKYIDPDGKENLIFLTQNDKEKIMGNSNFSDAPRVVIVTAHGFYSHKYDSKASGIVLARDFSGYGIYSDKIISTPKEFKCLVMNKSSEYKNNNERNITVILDVCGGAELAKKFSASEEFSGKNITFIGANNRVQAEIDEDGNISHKVKDAKIFDNNWKCIGIRKGEWLGYKDGEQIKTKLKVLK